MKSVTPKRVLLTFDVEGPPGREDFMNSYVLRMLYKILKVLEKYDLRGLFFITGNVVEKVCKDAEIFKLLEKHEIGFHSSSHSVKPRIFEYTDLPDYEDAVETSMLRETSKIDPFSGNIVGSGGIFTLRESFPGKNVESFRTPFDCLLPPHIEALRKLELRFSFSGNLSQGPIFYKGLTFYPRSLPIDNITSKILQVDHTKKSLFSPLFLEIADREFTIFDLHPCQMVYDLNDALSFHYKNPMCPFHLVQKNSLKTVIDLYLLKSFLSKLSKFQKMGLIDAAPELEDSKMFLDSKKVDIKGNYEYCLSIASGSFRYKPKFLLSHYYHFFGDVDQRFVTPPEVSGKMNENRQCKDLGANTILS